MSEPVLIALLFADRVITEEGNHKKSIIGTFSRFYSDKFPITFLPWFIYAGVTNLNGEFNFSFNLVYDKAQQVVVPIGGRFKVEGIRNIVELVFPIIGAVFPDEGVYTLTFNIEGMPVGSRILEVLRAPTPPAPNSPTP
jgi:hypothetical protein